LQKDTDCPLRSRRFPTPGYRISLPRGLIRLYDFFHLFKIIYFEGYFVFLRDSVKIWPHQSVYYKRVHIEFCGKVWKRHDETAMELRGKERERDETWKSSLLSFLKKNWHLRWRHRIYASTLPPEQGRYVKVVWRATVYASDTRNNIYHLIRLSDYGGGQRAWCIAINTYITANALFVIGRLIYGSIRAWFDYYYYYYYYYTLRGGALVCCRVTARAVVRPLVVFKHIIHSTSIRTSNVLKTLRQTEGPTGWRLAGGFRPVGSVQKYRELRGITHIPCAIGRVGVGRMVINNNNRSPLRSLGARKKGSRVPRDGWWRRRVGEGAVETLPQARLFVFF
jgi:hypothetical protein